MENVLRRYVKEYVTCHTCRSPDTILQKDTRLFFLQCETCGSRCSVASIKSGFQVSFFFFVHRTRRATNRSNILFCLFIQGCHRQTSGHSCEDGVGFWIWQDSCFAKTSRHVQHPAQLSSVVNNCWMMNGRIVCKRNTPLWLRHYSHSLFSNTQFCAHRRLSKTRQCPEIAILWICAVELNQV